MFKATFLTVWMVAASALAFCQQSSQPILIPSRIDLCAGDTFSLALASGAFSGNGTEKVYLITTDFGNVADTLESHVDGERLICQSKQTTVGSTYYQVFMEADGVVYTSMDRLRVLNPLTAAVSKTDYQFCFEERGRLYFRYRQPTIQTVAFSIAQKAGGKLASIPDSILNAKLAAWSDTAGCWFDFEDRLREGVWRRNNLQPNGFLSWDSTEPNNRGDHENYGAVRINGKWYDEFVDRQKSHFLEINTLNGDTVYTVPGGSIRLAAPAIAGAEVNWFGPNSFFSTDTVLHLPRVYVRPSQVGGVYGLIVAKDGCRSGLLPYPVKSLVHGLDTALFEKGPSFRGKRYYVSRFVVNWPLATQIAYMTGGMLAEPRDLQENTLIKSLRPNDEKWLGLSDTAEDRVFRYLSSDTIATFTNWAPSEPNNHLGREFAVEMRSNGRWNDIFPELIIAMALQVKESTVIDDPTDLVICPGTTDSVAYVVPGRIEHCRLELSTPDGAFAAPRRISFEDRNGYARFMYPNNLTFSTTYSLRLVDTVNGIYDYPNPSAIQVSNGDHIRPLLASVGDSIYIVNPYAGTNYEWYYNNGPMGVTGDYVIAPADGNFYVIARRNSCEAQSGTLNYSVQGTNNLAAAGISVSPNPVKGSFRIEGRINTGNVQVLDAQGRLVGEYMLPATGLHINASQWPRGMYMVQIRTKDRVVSGRVVLE